MVGKFKCQIQFLKKLPHSSIFKKFFFEVVQFIQIANYIDITLFTIFSYYLLKFVGSVVISPFLFRTWVFCVFVFFLFFLDQSYQGFTNLFVEPIFPWLC